MRNRLLVSVLVLLASSAFAEEFWQYAKSDVAALQLGKVLMGPPVSQASLAGNVVMVEFWGTQ